MHSKVWGCLDTNNRGEIIEDVIAENDLRLLNEKNLHIFILLREIIMLLICLFVILTYIKTLIGQFVMTFMGAIISQF